MKRRVKKSTVLMLILIFLLTACGKSDSSSDKTGLVSIETVKGYEHTVRKETEPVNEPDTGNEPNGDGSGQEGQKPDEPAVPDIKDEEYEETNDTVYVIVSKLNLRSGPSTDSDIVGKAVYGDSFTRLARGKNGWDRILYEGQVVYAYAEYLSTENITGKGNETEMSTLLADAKKK